MFPADHLKVKAPSFPYDLTHTTHNFLSRFDGRSLCVNWYFFEKVAIQCLFAFCEKTGWEAAVFVPNFERLIHCKRRISLLFKIQNIARQKARTFSQTLRY
ncbi:hypothetical protein TH1_00330 [Thalassospira lucentensis MCCC 1A00383 = DSM 14000]|nr:hypothetical protein TH1_00330 [Thalassospira lucentensis MCCC 1A00383 = DSM 14000]